MLSRWLITLFSYDGLLPATVVGLPAVMFYLGFPPVAIELTAIILPIVAYFYRMVIGLKMIDGNGCPNWLRGIQRITLFIALIPLVLVDAFMIVTWRIPRNGLGWGDLIVALYIYLFYLALMVLVTFPGKSSSHP